MLWYLLLLPWIANRILRTFFFSRLWSQTVVYRIRRHTRHCHRCLDFDSSTAKGKFYFCNRFLTYFVLVWPRCPLITSLETIYNRLLMLLSWDWIRLKMFKRHICSPNQSYLRFCLVSWWLNAFVYVTLFDFLFWYNSLSCSFWVLGQTSF